MKHTIHDFQQGSPEWLAHRDNCYNASDLAAAMGISSYKQRTSLIREIATGIAPEIDAATQRRFDDGHRFEALARPLAEEIVGEDLYPMTVSVRVDGLGRPLSASLDGATASDSINWEHKTLNDELAAALDQGIIPNEYHPQMEKGQFINGATRTLFMASKWDENNNLIDEKHCWYESNPELRAKIIPTWRQAEEDAANYQHVEVIPAAVAAPQMQLPAVSIQVNGSIALIDNLSVFGEALTAYVGKINQKPETDQDFADLDATVKTLKTAEDALTAAENSALAQTSSIDMMRRQVAQYKEIARVARLQAEKTVKAEKENRRAAIVLKGQGDLSEHVAGLNKRLGKSYMPAISANFAGAVKGLKTMTSIQNAVDSELARCKIEANAIADRIQENLSSLRELAADHAFLFSDTPAIIMKANDDLVSLIKSRIADHKAELERKFEAERARIRAEEEAKARAEAEAKLKAEQEEADRRQRERDEAAQAEFSRREAEERTAAAAQAKVAPAVSVVLNDKPVADSAAVQFVDSISRIKLGEICELLSIGGKPLILSSDQLSALGFDPVETVKAAKLYREQDFGPICDAISRHVQELKNEHLSLRAAA